MQPPQFFSAPFFICKKLSPDAGKDKIDADGHDENTGHDVVGPIISKRDKNTSFK